MLFFFFFKQKTAYELRISDWSSDVCSSDLQPPFRLTSLRAKAHALQEAGIDDLFVLHFDRAFSLKTAEAFVVEILVGDLAARHVVVGWDFCFGHKRAGNAGLLKRSEEHTSELQSLMRISYAVFCLKKKTHKTHKSHP